MITFQVFDAPIEHPDEDLFGTGAYARKLSYFIASVKPPFTVGIYGQWGDGKTSFVYLLNHYLASASPNKEIKFIKFSAWPHTASDAIWRALILCIAKDLYGYNEEVKEPDTKPNNTATQPKSTTTQPNNAATQPKSTATQPNNTATGPRERFVGLLKKDAWTAWSPPPADDPHKDYHDIIRRLDEIAYGGISKSKDEQQQFSEEAALAAMVKTGVAALGSLSPIIAGFRALFDLNPKADAAAGEFTQGKSTAARQLIESVDKYKQLLNDMFTKKAHDKRVLVFIDDLDRCLPDAALDLLEATKIFFEEIPCIFVVAADENLIGQGLRLRFKDLLIAQDQTNMEQLIAQKGKEYFEKIIQFPIRVPPRTSNQGHKFISAQFPAWTPATDIIQTAVGLNPRRLIQYCNLLSYKYDVYKFQIRLAQTNQDTADSVSFEYLDKLIALHAWFPECLDAFNRLLSDSNSYSKNTRNLERWLRKTREDSPRSEAEQELKACGCDVLYKKAVGLAPICRLMRAQPLFSAAPPDLLRAYLRMTDIRPSTEKSMLTVADSMFSRILSVVEEQDRTTPSELLIKDITKLITFDKTNADLALLLFAIAKRENGSKELQAIEQELENPEASTNRVKLQADSTELLGKLKTAAAANPQFTAFFLSTPRFSSINPEEISLYETVKPNLQNAKDLLNANFQSATGPERYSRNALEAIDLFPAAQRAAIESTLQLQIDVARYFVELRKFAKLDALAFKWPDLADKLRGDSNSFVRTYETPANESALPATDQVGILFQQDPRLRDFLRLRPLFSAINDRELKQYFAIAEVVVKASDIQAPAPPTAETPTVAPAPVIPVPPDTPVAYDNLSIRLMRKNGLEYQLIVKSEIGNKSFPIELNEEELAELNRKIQNLFLYRTGTRQIIGASQMTSFGRDPMDQLTDLGLQLYNKLFSGNAAETIIVKTIDESLKNDRGIRILIGAGKRIPSFIPWEALYIPSLRLFPALTTQGFSMVRLLPMQDPITPRTMHSPLRILLAISTPTDAPYLEVGRERAMLEESIGPALANGLVRLEIIEHATNDKLLRAFSRFRPNIFHFTGHGVLQRDSKEFGQGALVLETETGKTDLLSGENLKTIMGHDSSVSLAILNACETGSTAAGDAFSGVAQHLIETGTPAVIATMRPILDQAALIFTREFYRSFVDGFPLESSLIEARKNLSINQIDWSAYALFSGTDKLDDFKLAPTQPLRVSTP